MSTPDLVEPIIGYRVWDVRGGVLEAVSGSERWIPGVPARSHCRNHPHAPRNSFMAHFVTTAQPTYYHINCYLPMRVGEHWRVGNKTYTVTAAGRGQNAQMITIASETIAGANVMVTEHPEPPHRHGPHWGCYCGFHAFKTERDLADADMVWEATDRVWGRVALWGRVIEHETGYRAEYAYPVELNCGDRKLARKLAAVYGVPCNGPTGDMGDEMPETYPPTHSHSMFTDFHTTADTRSRFERFEAWSYRAPIWQPVGVVVAGSMAAAGVFVALINVVASNL